MKISRLDIWAAPVEDRPGGLAARLEMLAQAGANLEFLLARRAPEIHGDSGVAFVAPLKGARQLRAARDAGFSRTSKLHALRVETPNKPGVAAKLTRLLARHRFNLRGVCGSTLGGKSTVLLAFDSAADSRRASRLLRQF